MKAVILAGGFGTRISEETALKPKPMVTIGERPILWHIMKIYSHHGVNDFVICLGYKGYLIKEYIINYYHHMSDITVDLSKNTLEIHTNKSEPWRVTLVDTGENVMTGGRLKRVSNYLKDEKSFCMTYGDGLSDVDITALIKHHNAHGKLATVTAVKPPGRFGALKMQGDAVQEFVEKPRGDGEFVNGGFFVLSPKVLDYIDGDSSVWESGALEKLSEENQLMAYKHHGFWQPIDTLRDKNYVEELWTGGKAPWKLWA